MKKLNLNVIINLLLIYLLLLSTTSITRILMAKSFISSEIDESLAKMYFYGFLYDNRILSIVILAYLLLYTITKIGGGLWHKILGRKQENSVLENKILENKPAKTPFLNKTLKILSPKVILNIYIFIIAFVILLSCFINYYYFELYKSKIDIFIFGLKDDDTKAVLGVVFSNYPIFWILLGTILFSLILCFINSYFLRAKILVRGYIVVALYVFIVIISVIGIRGSLSTFPLREADNRISNFEVINHLNTNPILAFFWALNHYQNDYTISKISKDEFESLAAKNFPIYFKTQNLSNFKPPHIVVNLMESFGSHLLIYEDSNFDLLGRLKKHLLNPLEHSSLGMQCDRFAKFRIVADSSLASYPKFSKNSHSHTANIRMLGDSNGIESLDSRDSKDSKLRLESSKIDLVCGTHPKEASSGERESVREGEGSELRVCLQLRGESRSKIQAPSPSLKNGRLDKGNLVEDSKELKDSLKESLEDSKELEDSKKEYSLDSKNSKIFKDSNIESSLDSTPCKDNAKESISDFTFFRFISSGIGTAGSFSELYFLSPNAAISQGKYKATYLKDTPFDVYKNAGYEVIFITSGNAAWQGLGEYLKAQGVDKIYDMNYFIAKFKKAMDNISSWGTLDEFIYKEIVEILSSAKKPTFIFTLTTSNHPPFQIPSDFKELELKDEMSDLLLTKSSPNKVIQAYAYSLDSFGGFLDEVKKSSFKDNVIILATGDHKLRDLKMPKLEHSFLSYAVPLYIYLPHKLQDSLSKNGVKISYNPLRVGSHKDIFPTLYNLSLSSTPYFSLGGRNMLSPPKDKALEFGMHLNTYITDSGFVSNNQLFKWSKNDFNNLEDIVLNEATSIEVLDKDFKSNYDRLNKMQLDLRLSGEDLRF